MCSAVDRYGTGSGMVQYWERYRDRESEMVRYRDEDKDMAGYMDRGRGQRLKGTD